MRELDGPALPLRENAWQKYCAGILHECIALPASSRVHEWADARQQLMRLARRLIPTPTQQRIIIADATLTGADLKGFDFRYCFFIRTHLENADVRNCSFKYAIFRGCSLHRAKADQTDFQYADFGDTNLQEIFYDRKTSWNLAKRVGGAISPGLDERVEHDRLVSSGRNFSPLVRLFQFLTDYGIGIGRFLFICIIVDILFAIVYNILNRNDFAIGAGSTKPASITFWNFLLLSFERFFNASPWIYGIAPLAHFLTTLETLFGLFALAILISMIVHQVLRR